MDKKVAKKFLFRVADIIENHGISVFLSDGTCLGAYREKDFIEWETDIDIKMRAEELVPKIEILSNEFSKEGYDVRPVMMGPIWYGLVLWLGEINLDLHGLFLINNRRWRLGNRYKHTYPAELFDNPGQIEFFGRKFYVPTPVEKYLECLYGSDYMTPKKVINLTPLRAEGTFGQIKAKSVPRYEILSGE